MGWFGSSAPKKFKDFEAEIEALLRRERPSDVRALLHRPTVPTGFSGLYAAYHPFTVWMYRFDDLKKRPLAANISSYLVQRNRHEQQVKDVLSEISRHETGRALFDEIDRIGKDVLIYPYWSFGDGTPSGRSLKALLNIGRNKYRNENYKFFGGFGLNATAQRFRDPDEDGHSDIAISFTASMWGPTKFDRRSGLLSGTAGRSGPGSLPDELLFHELVHATRSMLLAESDHSTVNNAFGNKEEYIAVVVTNIYTAEKASDPKHPKLRASHDGFGTLSDPADFLNNKAATKPSPRELLKELFNSQQRPFYVKVGSLPESTVFWNPARVVGRELKLVAP